MKMLLTALLVMGLSTSVYATAKPVPVEEVAGMGGFGNLSTASQVVGGLAVGLVALYAIQQNKFDCTITKTAPLPGTNYTNERSACVEK